MVSPPFLIFSLILLLLPTSPTLAFFYSFFRKQTGKQTKQNKTKQTKNKEKAW